MRDGPTIDRRAALLLGLAGLGVGVAACSRQAEEEPQWPALLFFYTEG
jgi:hypothetical protein